MSSDFPERSLTTAVAIESGFNLDPLSTYASLREQFSGESVLLESVEGTKKTARYSFIGVDPVHTFVSRDGTVFADGESHKVENPFESLRNRFKAFECGTSARAPFSGGMVGHVVYGTVRYF